MKISTNEVETTIVIYPDSRDNLEDYMVTLQMQQILLRCRIYKGARVY